MCSFSILGKSLAALGWIENRGGLFCFVMVRLIKKRSEGGEGVYWEIQLEKLLVSQEGESKQSLDNCCSRVSCICSRAISFNKVDFFIQFLVRLCVFFMFLLGEGLEVGGWPPWAGMSGLVCKDRCLICLEILNTPGFIGLETKMCICIMKWKTLLFVISLWKTKCYWKKKEKGQQK